jgi:hypothetical protein
MKIKMIIMLPVLMLLSALGANALRRARRRLS